MHARLELIPESGGAGRPPGWSRRLPPRSSYLAEAEVLSMKKRKHGPGRLHGGQDPTQAGGHLPEHRPGDPRRQYRATLAAGVAASSSPGVAGVGDKITRARRPS